ncbi:MAG: hypothetical protein KAT65_06670 [Methanophagales archaeon]|nr:hypothetical protein [Methanophagales archaeon]
MTRGKKQHLVLWIVIVLVILIISLEISFWLTNWVEEPYEFKGIETSWELGGGSIIMECITEDSILIVDDEIACKLNYSNLSDIETLELHLCSENLEVLENFTLNLSEKEEYMTFKFKETGDKYFCLLCVFRSMDFVYLCDHFPSFYTYKDSEEFFKLKREYELKYYQIIFVGTIGIFSALLSIISFLYKFFFEELRRIGRK